MVPRFYRRDEAGLPREWLATMKQAMRIAGQSFTGRRMVEEYARNYYVPSMMGTDSADDPPTG